MSETRENARALLAAANAGRGSVDVTCEGPGAADVSALLQAAPELLSTLIAEADASERRAVEAEAGAAVLREALTRLVGVITTDPEAHSYNCIRSNDPCECWASDVLDDCGVAAALTNPAGRAILDRLERAEAERGVATDCYRETRAALTALYESVAAVADVGALPDGESLGPEASHEANALAEAFTAIVAERDALRAENAELAVKVQRMEGRVPAVCTNCRGESHPGPRFSVGTCPKCGGSGAVIVEGET